ncbi:MAG: altronate dehydratase family protein [Anaerolineae bacterium]
MQILDPVGEARVVVLHPDDDVAVARTPLVAGRAVEADGRAAIVAREVVPVGHKIALRAVPSGAPVHRYGQVIGFATADIAPGAHVHTHNLGVADLERDFAFGVDCHPINLVPQNERRTFQGYIRHDGRVGTRNTIALISSVNCSAHTTRRIAERARAELLPDYPFVDDIVALTHKNGCGTRFGGPEIAMLQRTLAGFARHPNVAGFVLVSLGCEINQLAPLIEAQTLYMPGEERRLPPMVMLQEEGGVAATVERGLAAVAQLLPVANRARRTTVDASALSLALQCGGSDGWSGITANPALGYACDLIVGQGGTVVLSETPEIYGAEHLLTRRAVSSAVGQQLVDRIAWWQDYTGRNGFEMDNNPTPGNKAGGLTTIYEKSLGAVAKAGTSPLVEVLEYAYPIQERGFVYMDTPGYDPVSVTGQVAGGCNMVAFTTGRGSCFGFKPVPSIKIASNSEMYARMLPDMDVNAGRILDGATIQEVGEEIFELLLRVASGEPSKSEAQGIGEEEFNPWIIGATM